MGLGKTLTMISLILKQKQLKEKGTDEDKQAWLNRDKQLEKCMNFTLYNVHML